MRTIRRLERIAATLACVGLVSAVVPVGRADSPVGTDAPAVAGTTSPAPGPAPDAAEHPADAATPEAIDVAAPAPGPRSPGVALARFTTAVENREPIDSVSFLPNDRRRVLFYTDLRHLAGTTVIHRWEYAGEVMAEVPFEVGSDRWRVWSTKALEPDWVGDWTASVIGPGGEVLAIETFTYQAPD